jgi:hypothetical protein
MLGVRRNDFNVRFFLVSVGIFYTSSHKPDAFRLAIEAGSANPL